jgi:type II secretory pathway component PulF
MNNLLKTLNTILPNLVKLLSSLGQLGKLLPWVLVCGIIGGIGYFAVINHKDPYKCINNEIYEQIRWDSDVYKFLGGYCA